MTGLAKAIGVAVLPLAAGFLPQQAQAAEAPKDGFTFNGNIRLRYEAIDGQARAGFNPSEDWVSSRTILHLDYKHDWLQVVGELWDSRVWNTNRGSPVSTTDVNTLEPVQAYIQADLGKALGADTHTTVVAGRFMLAVGSRRLIAADDYRNTTSGYTGIRADVTNKQGTTFTGFYVMPQTRLPDAQAQLLDNASALDKESLAAVLWGGLVSHQAKGSRFMKEAVFVHFGEHDQPGRNTRDRSLNNINLRAGTDPKLGKFDWGVEGIYQWGHASASTAPTAATLNVSATFLRATLGYSMAGKWKPHILAELDRASGDGTSGTYGRFDTLFGMRRADLGPAGLYSELGRSNLLTPGIRVEVTPSKATDAFLGYRALWLADAHDSFSNTSVRDAKGQSGTFAGHQIDMRLRHWLVPKRLRFELDSAFILRGEFLERAPNRPAGDTKYVSLNVTGFF
ncbi:hypothetical protein EOE18_16665 [Novosphingobium umbonatum]|uniref:Alginate export domain-containing protein n=2 Tax=Novosphingobium umbonatum TaxID=1908524 RepID=A0A3S2X1I3_9SPHN|nr:hypothetical protein EOE18_16665 [Novosphingobium umbonatum]